MARLTGGRAELAAEIALFGTERPHHRGRRPHARVELFEDVVIDERDIDILVAAAFTGGGIDFA